MQNEVTFEYTRSLIKAATRRFVWRRAGGALIACVILAVLGLAGLVLHRSPELPWLPMFLILVPVAFGIAWLRYYRNVFKVFESMPDRRVTVKVEPETLTMQTLEHSSTLKWSRIKILWRFPDVLLLFPYGRNSSYVMLAVEPLGEELRRFIEDKVREHGGAVS